MREGVHPEKTPLPYTPEWDLVGVVEKIGEEASQATVGQMVAALPIHGGYAQYICLPQDLWASFPAMARTNGDKRRANIKSSELNNYRLAPVGSCERIY
jgi:NADPH:quinone reductase-like Zn-dependent oxidoreductase